MDEAMQKRMEDNKEMIIEKRAYQKFKDIIKSDDMKTNPNDINGIKLRSAIMMFYTLGEPEESRKQMQSKINNIKYEDLKNAALELSGEAINRDMLVWIKTGIRGKMASQMYNILKPGVISVSK